MFAAAREKKRDQAGFISVEYMLAVGLSLLFLVMMTNIVVIQYGRGVVRASVDEGVRSGALVTIDPIARCNDRAISLLASIDGLGTSNVQCSIVGNEIHATATANFDGWLPWMPTLSEQATAVSHKEQAPS